MTIEESLKPTAGDKYRKTNRLRGIQSTEDCSPPLFVCLDEAKTKIEFVLRMAEAYSTPSSIPLNDKDYQNISFVIHALCIPDNKNTNMHKRVETCTYYKKIIKKDEDALIDIMNVMIENYENVNLKIIS